jgi:hypothetical protein
MRKHSRHSGSQSARRKPLASGCVAGKRSLREHMVASARATGPQARGCAARGATLSSATGGHTRPGPPPALRSGPSKAN